MALNILDGLKYKNGKNNIMKPKSDKPPKYLKDSFNKHLEKIFSQPSPYTTAVMANTFRMAKNEFYKLKKYKENE